MATTISKNGGYVTGYVNLVAGVGLVSDAAIESGASIFLQAVGAGADVWPNDSGAGSIEIFSGDNDDERIVYWLAINP